MISKTSGFRGTLFSDTPVFQQKLREFSPSSGCGSSLVRPRSLLAFALAPGRAIHIGHQNGGRAFELFHQLVPILTVGRFNGDSEIGNFDFLLMFMVIHGDIIHDIWEN